MARAKLPTIPDDKVMYFREQLYRELSHLFKWEGLPTTIPSDYIERNLVRNGRVMVYKHKDIGLDVLRAEITGFNRHDLPTNARSFTPTTNSETFPSVDRIIKRLADSENAAEEFDEEKDCVMIYNMDFGENCSTIVEHFAERMGLVQQAFDTNILWANLPYIFQTESEDVRLSIEKMFSSLYTGEPFIIVDKELLVNNKDSAGKPTGIKFIAKEIMDILNELMMKFRETVGFNTAGIDKAERVNTLEIKSNDQHTESVVDIMLSQRQLAAETMNTFFGTNISVTLVGEVDIEDYEDEEGEEEDGIIDSGTQEPSEN